MRRLVFALLAVLSLAVASPAAAQAPLQDFKNKGTIPPCKFNDRQLGKSLGDLPPDIEQYAPGYAEQLRNNRGAACGGKGAPGGDGATTGVNERVEDVPVPPSVGGSGGAGGGPGAPGSTTGERVGKPPIPVPTPRTKLADVTSPAITSGPTGPDVPAWVLALIALVLLGGSALTALFLYGADLSRFTRPLGVAAGEARARTSDRAIELWETVRLGR